MQQPLSEPTDLDRLLERLNARLDRLDDAKNVRRGSRFAAPGASPEVLEHLAAGGAIRTIEQPGLSGEIHRRARSAARGDGSDGARHVGLAEIMTKALAEGTPSAGGYLVPVELSNEIVMTVRARSAVMNMGPTVVPVKKELDVASISTGASAAYVAENAAIPTSQQTFAGGALLVPKELAALVPVP